MSTSDRMVLMYNGRVEQVGAPDQMYTQPRSAFAAAFLGIPNLLRGRMAADHGSFVTDAGPVLRLAGQAPVAGPACLALRPEVVAIVTTAPDEGVNALAGRVEVMSFHGAAVEYQIATEAGLRMTARTTAPGLGGATPVPQGSRIWLCWSPSAGVIVSEH